jgi:hypothetical protein
VFINVKAWHYNALKGEIMANYKTQDKLNFERQIVQQLNVKSNQWRERKDLYEATPDLLWVLCS